MATKTKISEVTPEMFENWKAEMRKVFEKDKKSMNLINICLNGLDKATDEAEIKKFNKQLLEFHKVDLAHSNQLVCPKCGQPMEVYYTAQCFRCNKPEIKNCEGNYLMARNWLKHNEPDFDEDYVWSWLCDHEIIRGNDSYIKIPDDCQTNARYNQNIRLFKKHFDIETTKWFVSW